MPIVVRKYAKNAPVVDANLKPKHIQSIEEVRRRALLKKDGEKLKLKVQEDALDPLIRQAYDELEDEDRVRQGLPPIHAWKYARKTGVGARKGRKKSSEPQMDIRANYGPQNTD